MSWDNKSSIRWFNIYYVRTYRSLLVYLDTVVNATACLSLFALRNTPFQTVVTFRASRKHKELYDSLDRSFFPAKIKVMGFTAEANINLQILCNSYSFLKYAAPWFIKITLILEIRRKPIYTILEKTI